MGLEEPKRYSASVASDSTKTRCSTRDENSVADINFVEDKLAPVDGGLRAWLFVLACSMMEALVWGEIDNPRLICVEMILTMVGYADAFGVFQDYYSEHEPFKKSGNIAVIGTCAMVCFRLSHMNLPS